MDQNRIIENKFGMLESKISNINRDTDAKIVAIQNQNKNIISTFGSRFELLEKQINTMDVALKELQRKYEENVRRLNELEPKVGQKRKWWQVVCY